MSIVGPGAPYVSPAVLMNAPTGISWKTIPSFNATDEERYTEATNLAQRASAAIDAYCETSLRATINTETVYGPGNSVRFQMQSNGNARIELSRPPVVSVLSGTCQVASDFSGSIQQIPAASFKVERPVIGIYGTSALGPVGESGQAVLLQPGYVSWFNGRMGFQVSVTYLNGYPHSQLLADVSSGSNTIHVDDITGMVGAFCTIYSADDALQEAVSVLSVVPDTVGAISGPGVMTLTANLVNDHVAGELCTTLPASIQQAAILWAASFALVRGGTSTSVQQAPGTGTNTGKSGRDEMTAEAKMLVNPYKRAR